jgi:hypothetical protein
VDRPCPVCASMFIPAITPTELLVSTLCACSSPLRQEEIDGCREAFSSFDKDGSGYIDAAELRSVLEAMGQRPTEEVRRQARWRWLRAALDAAVRVGVVKRDTQPSRASRCAIAARRGSHGVQQRVAG